ncbi:hypothetical protein SDC9_155552 [bioreactor metagenome]|uniref:Uncharacterized protein n=1 Tax=bioreactor metagenome TaxID=1076179 RepID=A0A645F372_9ZZZZ
MAPFLRSGASVLRFGGISPLLELTERLGSVHAAAAAWAVNSDQADWRHVKNGPPAGLCPASGPFIVCGQAAAFRPGW